MIPYLTAELGEDELDRAHEQRVHQRRRDDDATYKGLVLDDQEAERTEPSADIF